MIKTILNAVIVLLGATIIGLCVYLILFPVELRGQTQAPVTPQTISPTDDPTVDPAEKPHRRLENIRIDTVEGKLRWTISEGEMRDGKYEPLILLPEYEVDLDAATMRLGSEKRSIGQEDVGVISRIVSLVVRYMVESTIWWESGQGVPVEQKKPATKTAGAK